MVTQTLEYTVRRHADGRTVIATVTGDWDSLSDGALVRKLHGILDEGYRNIVVDAVALAFCDSAGLGALVELYHHTSSNGGWLRVVAPSAAVRRPIELTGLDQLFQVRASATAAEDDDPER